MSYYSEKEAIITELRAQVATQRNELEKLQEMRTRVQPLVAGAMRQGYVNKWQEEALLYAFMALTGETNELLARALIWVTPKSRARLALPKPRDEDVPPYESPDYNNSPWGDGI